MNAAKLEGEKAAIVDAAKKAEVDTQKAATVEAEKTNQSLMAGQPPKAKWPRKTKKVKTIGQSNYSLVGFTDCCSRWK